MNKAVFLDRDGTINIDKKFLYRISDFEFIPGAKEALLLFQKAGYRLIIITNQSGVARGYYSEDDVRKLNDWLRKTLALENILISGIYYCPHHPSGIIEDYRQKCDCRKPNLGLFYRAAADFGIDLDKSFAIGDRMRDLRICTASGCRGYLLRDSKMQVLPPNIKTISDLTAAAAEITEIAYLPKR